MEILEICLENKSPIPGYIGNFIHKPNKIVWLSGSRYLPVIEQVNKTISQHFSPEIEIRKYQQDDIPDFINACEKIIKDFPDHEIIMNVTGGEKLYSLLAAETFKKAGKTVSFLDFEYSRVIDIATGKVKSCHYNFTVNEYFNLYNCKIATGKRFDPEIGKRSKLSYFIGNNIDHVVPFIDKIQKEWNQMGNEKRDTKWNLSYNGINLIIEYTSSNSSMNFTFSNSNKENKVEIKKQAAEFLFKGGWLRELVFLRIHRSQHDDARLDIRIDRNSIPKDLNIESMLDISMIRGANLYIFQCFSFPITKESYTELNFVKATINHFNARGIIFLAHRPHRGFLIRAKESGINVIYGKRISNFTI